MPEPTENSHIEAISNAEKAELTRRHFLAITGLGVAAGAALGAGAATPALAQAGSTTSTGAGGSEGSGGGQGPAKVAPPDIP